MPVWFLPFYILLAAVAKEPSLTSKLVSFKNMVEKIVELFFATAYVTLECCYVPNMHAFIGWLDTYQASPSSLAVHCIRVLRKRKIHLYYRFTRDENVSDIFV